ncbi:KPCD kinase, partial [Aphelocoma coerulescens]|nr:KPCD kinase [Aphelocoma coerulescens]
GREGAPRLTSHPNILYLSNLFWKKITKFISNCLPSPTQKSANDYNNFDREFLSEKPKLSYSDKNLIESMDQSAFNGFSFINPKFEQILNK